MHESVAIYVRAQLTKKGDEVERKTLSQLAKKRGLKGYTELNKAKSLKQLKVKVDPNPHRIDKKLQEQAEELNWNGINFPASWKDIDKFEKNNPTISVNVYGYENGIGVSENQ